MYYIAENHRQSDQAVLVFDHLGISGCVTIVIAYLMKLYNFRMDVSCSCMSTEA